MTIIFNRSKPEDRYLELGGGANPIVTPTCRGGHDVNVDVRACYDANGNITTDFTADFNEPLPIQDNDFDGVISVFSLEHVSWRKVKDFIKEMHRVIKAGAKAIVVTANTEAQIKHIQDNPNGWEDRDIFMSASCTLFGDMDYPENSHRSYFSPTILTQLFQEAGFENIVVQPYGAINTDLVLEAVKPFPKKAEEKVTLSVPTGYNPAELFDRHYFDGGAKVGGYKPFYWDFPAHALTAQHVLARKPETVLELGTAKGYVVKRLQDAGIPAWGLDVSKHCSLTSACENFILYDATKTPWPETSDKEIDLCLSVGLFDHIPENLLPQVFSEMERVCKRGLHGIGFNPMDDGDKTRCTIHDKVWWQSMLPRGHEVVDKAELETGGYSEDFLKGDGKIKINAGSAMTMFHHGWINLDPIDLSQFAAQWGYQFKQCDVRQGLPWGTGSIAVVFSSHMMEHLTYDEGLNFLYELRRVIKPDGVCRFILPNAELLSEMYVNAPPGESAMSLLSEFDEINANCARAGTAAGKLHALLNENHKSTYDWETFAEALKDAGFQPKLTSFRQTMCGELGQQILRETTDQLPCLSFYMEAVPI